MPGANALSSPSERPCCLIPVSKEGRLSWEVYESDVLLEPLARKSLVRQSATLIPQRLGRCVNVHFYINLIGSVLKNIRLFTQMTSLSSLLFVETYFITLHKTQQRCSKLVLPNLDQILISSKVSEGSFRRQSVGPGGL